MKTVEDDNSVRQSDGVLNSELQVSLIIPDAVYQSHHSVWCRNAKFKFQSLQWVISNSVLLMRERLIGDDLT